MGIEQLDFLYQQSQAMLALIEAGKVDATKLDEAETLVNGLIPMITEEIQKVAGDGQTWYNYECSGCSLGCKKEMKFRPVNEKTLKECELDRKNVANFEEVSVGGES